MKGRFTNRVAIVSGAAHGIGQAIATRFAHEGATVVIADTDAERGAAHAAHIGGHFIATDVSDEAAVRTLIQETEQRFGRLDTLVSNACIYRGGTAEATTLDAWNALLAVNLTASFFTGTACNAIATRPKRRIDLGAGVGASTGRLSS